MVWQPTAVLYPDAELVVTGLLRDLLAEQESSSSSSGDPADDIWVGRKLPATRPARAIQVVRDGGNVANLRDQARMRVLVWDRTEQAATDLARLVVALMPLMCGRDDVLRVLHLSGPYEIVDADPKRYLLFQVDLRGELLA